MATAQPLELMVKELPLHDQAEVKNFVELLMQKRRKGKAKKLKQEWAGGIVKFKKKYTSLELQKKALEWRVNYSSSACRSA